MVSARPHRSGSSPRTISRRWASPCGKAASSTRKIDSIRPGRHRERAVRDQIFPRPECYWQTDHARVLRRRYRREDAGNRGRSRERKASLIEERGFAGDVSAANANPLQHPVARHPDERLESERAHELGAEGTRGARCDDSADQRASVRGIHLALAGPAAFQHAVAFDFCGHRAAAHGDWNLRRDGLLGRATHE